jgi:hypothetical protein
MMTYTRTERKRICNVFKQALTTLPDRIGYMHGANSPYICDNINSIDSVTDADHTAKRLAKRIINERIDHCFGVDAWLKEQGDDICDQVIDDMNYHKGKKLQAYRKAWLESLVKEFSK